MKAQEVLQRTQEFFNKKGIPNARVEAEVLLAHGLGWQRIELYTKFDSPLSEAELSHCRGLVQRRMNGEPLAYIVGHQDFYGSSFVVGPGVLIPRPETEELVEISKELLKKYPTNELKIADFGAGSGCIGISLACEFKFAEVDLFEVSLEAQAAIDENIQKHELSDRCKLIKENLDQADAKDFMSRGHWQYHLIASNPPYIDERDIEVAEEVKEFEPHQALFAADEGLAKIKSWGDLALEVLLPGGSFVLEMGWKQSQAVSEYFKNNENVASVKIEKDFSGHNRFAIVTKKNLGPIA